jgi:dipeptidase
MVILTQNKRRLAFWITFAIVLAASVAAIHIITNSVGFDEESFPISKSCSSFAAGKLASIDGSVMAGHTLDGPYDFRLAKIPSQKYKPGDWVRIDYPGIEGGWKHTVRGETKIPQAPLTCAYFHSDCPIANEYQIFFGENTCRTREELRILSPEVAILDWTQVAKLALQRGKTAREAIKVAGALIERFGLEGEGESFLVADPKEAWCFEIPGYTNEWVAQRIPVDHVCPHANRMRIGEIDLNDPENYMASPNIIKTAQKKGFYDAAKDGVFHFAKVYNDDKNMKDMSNRRREWRLLSLLCPSQKWDPEALIYPFSVKPDKKISAQWWLDSVWRDQLEKTSFDLTKGIAAGPFGCPGRPLLSDMKFERTICIGEMTYSWVSQSRDWLPDSIGGVFWFGMDTPRSNC